MIHFFLNRVRQRNSKCLADAANRAAFERLMPRDGSDGKIRRVHPEVVFFAVMIECAAVPAKMLLEGADS